MPSPVTVFVTAFVVGLSGALMPGPLTVVVLHGAITSGPLAGPLATLSHGLLELAMVAALVAGMSRVLRRRGVAAALALVGGLVLLWMGWGMVATAPAAALPASGAAAPAGAGPFVAGIAATLANPYWFLWWATVGASQLAWARSVGNQLAFWGGHVLADLAWLTLLAIAVAGGRTLLTDSTYRGVLFGLGGTIMLLGGYFLVSAGRLSRPEQRPRSRPSA